MKRIFIYYQLASFFSASRAARILLPLSLLAVSCEKLVTIDPPVNTIVTEQVFADDKNAVASIMGMYSTLGRRQYFNSFTNGGLSILCSQYTDELVPFGGGSDEIYKNGLTPRSFVLPTIFSQAYQSIYQANAIIEGLSHSNGVSQHIKDQLTGEALFARAFCYYYLVGVWGGISYITTTDWKENMAVAYSTEDEIIAKSIEDLERSKNLLEDEYNDFSGERTRATKFAAYAMLARYYALKGNWGSVVQYCSMIIDEHDVFRLTDEPKDAFLKNSAEAILQWHNTSQQYPFNALTEARTLIPLTNTNNPNYYLSQDLLHKFDTADLRRKQWIGETNYRGIIYHYPYKYKVGTVNAAAGAPVTEYYMVIRLADMILLRAEAYARQNQLDAAVDDVNTIRARARIIDIPALSGEKLIWAIADERSRELFCEWGARFIDLKRMGLIDELMAGAAARKGGEWAAYKRLFPIPLVEITLNPLSTQNTGYN